MPEYYPAWSPMPKKAWTLVDVHSGEQWPRPQRAERAKRFDTAQDAIQFARRQGIMLVDWRVWWEE